MDFLARLVTDIEFTLQDDLAFVVGIGVDKWGALLESVETTADGLLGVGTADDVA